jgi:tetratricopeptide (TPR) repeat protein
MAIDPTSPTAMSPSAAKPLTPEARKRLQQYFTFGQQKQRQGDHGYAHSMYSQCVVGDPSNLVYVEAMLDNLQACYKENRRKARVRSSRNAFKKAHTESRWEELFGLGVELIEENPWDIPTLRGMAEACAALHYNEVELRYLKNALDSNPKDVEVNRHCAHSLARMGQFDQAIACWHRIEELKPGNAEARKMISELTLEKNRAASGYADEKPATDGVEGRAVPPQTRSRDSKPSSTEHQPLTRDSLEAAILRDPANTKNYLDLANLLKANGELKEAEQVLRRAVQAAGNDATIRELLDDVQLELVRRQLAIAEKRQKEHPSEPSEKLVLQLRQDLNRLELSIFQNRSRRYPGRLDVQYELALRLQRAGLFPEAIQHFEVAAGDAARAAACSLHAGECQQHLRQYKDALKSYVAAIQHARNGNHADELKWALYRAAVLAEGLKRPDLARNWLEDLLKSDPNFRDARSRLDNLPAA